MTPDTITLDHVLIVRQVDLGWLCEIQGRPTFLGKLQIAAGSRMPREGQRGPVRLTVVAATDLGLLRRRYG